MSLGVINIVIDIFRFALFVRSNKTNESCSAVVAFFRRRRALDLFAHVTKFGQTCEMSEPSTFRQVYANYIGKRSKIFWNLERIKWNVG